MSDDLGELLRKALDDIDEIGGSERHLLAQTIGRPTYDALVSKAKGADLVSRWLDAGSKAKGPATRALALQIARVADRADLTDRIEREIGDAFDEGRVTTERSPTPIETKKHAAVNQRRNGQRSGYQAPKGVNLALLAKGDDVGRYIKARSKEN